MATAASAIVNGQSEANGTNGDLSAAQKLMLKHDEHHTATIEDVPDEDDLKHGELPTSSSILEAADEAAAPPSWTPPVSAKAAGKQKAEEPQASAPTPSLDTQSHELFPELGSGPKPSNSPSVGGIWSGKKPPGLNGTNGSTPTNGISAGSAPTSGTATPTSRGGPGNMAIPGRHTERISLAPSQIIPRSQMKKPLPDIIKDINKRSKATITMTTGNAGLLWFSATGPEAACRQALKDVVEQIGAKVSLLKRLSFPC